MTDSPLRILDTGTRRPASVPSGIDLRHQPALVRRPLTLEPASLPEVLDRSCHIVFYSQFAVSTVADADIVSEPERHRFWAVGEQTKNLIAQRFGVDVDFGDTQEFESLRDKIAACDEPLPIVAFGLRGRSRDLTPVAAKWAVEVREIPVYESTAAKPSDLAHAFDEHRPHWLTVTSSRGVESVVEAIGAQRLGEKQSAGSLHIAAIGPSTAQTLRKFDLQADLVPKTPDRALLLKAITEFHA